MSYSSSLTYFSPIYASHSRQRVRGLNKQHGALGRECLRVVIPAAVCPHCVNSSEPMLVYPVRSLFEKNEGRSRVISCVQVVGLQQQRATLSKLVIGLTAQVSQSSVQNVTASI